MFRQKLPRAFIKTQTYIKIKLEGRKQHQLKQHQLAKNRNKVWKSIYFTFCTKLCDRENTGPVKEFGKRTNARKWSMYENSVTYANSVLDDKVTRG